MGRTPCCDKANVKKGPWAPEEDAKLKSYIEKNGTGGNWIALPQKIGLKRCGKSCRLRWLNYLRPNIKHGGFSEEEDNIICNMYISIGSRWSIIASQLPGRTDNDIKNYWNTRLKKKLFGKPKRDQNYQNRRISDLKKESKKVNIIDENYNLNNICSDTYTTSMVNHEKIYADTCRLDNFDQNSITKLLLNFEEKFSSNYNHLLNHTSSSSMLPQLICDESANLVDVLPSLQTNSCNTEGLNSYTTELDEIFCFNNVELESLDCFYGMTGDNTRSSSDFSTMINWNEVNPLRYQNI